jgi:hypothetical protein
MGDNLKPYLVTHDRQEAEPSMYVRYVNSYVVYAKSSHDAISYIANSYYNIHYSDLSAEETKIHTVKYAKL